MASESTVIYCANHPNVETLLRCNKCEKPICAKCAVLTPTGYTCKECIKGQQKVFNSAEWYDYPIIFVIVSVLAYLGSLLTLRLGFWMIFLAPIAGGLIAEVARFVTRRRRSRQLYAIAALAAVVGCLPVSIQVIQHFSLLPLIYQVVYAVLMTSTFYYRLSGIKIG